MKEKILLGYEIGTGKEVKLSLAHLIVTGMTQLSGKTTTLEGLLSRSKLTALTFRTKRGELGFDEAKPVQPYFDEKGLTHWRALEGLLSATLEEKVQREPGVRGAIIRLCSGATGLQDIYRRNTASLEDAKGFMRDVHEKIRAYLDLVMPQLREYKFASTVEMGPGLNMMDLEGMSDELQALVIFATTTWIHKNSRDTILVMPEAWKYLPQDRGSPCKVAVEQYVREGAVIGNYLWLDSQDLRGVDKKFLRHIDNWILGRQRDPREIESTLEAIPLSKRLKPLPEEIMKLDIGRFIACLHDDVKRVYVQPAWLNEGQAKNVALGVTPAPTKQAKPLREDLILDPNHIFASKKDLEGFAAYMGKQAKDYDSQLAQLEIRLRDDFSKSMKELQQMIQTPARAPVSLELEQPDTQLHITRRSIKLNLSDGDPKARIVLTMMTEPEQGWTTKTLLTGLGQRGWGISLNQLLSTLQELTGLGIVNPVKAGKRTDYHLVKDKITVEN